MGYEERMDARSDFIAEHSPNCDDCGKGEEKDETILDEIRKRVDRAYSQGYKDGIRSRKFYNLQEIKEPFQKISAILTGYGNIDPNIRKLRVEFFKLACYMFNTDTDEFVKPCPCRKECKF